MLGLPFFIHCRLFERWEKGEGSEILANDGMTTQNTLQFGKRYAFFKIVIPVICLFFGLT